MLGIGKVGSLSQLDLELITSLPGSQFPPLQTEQLNSLRFGCSGMLTLITEGLRIHGDVCLESHRGNLSSAEKG